MIVCVPSRRLHLQVSAVVNDATAVRRRDDGGHEHVGTEVLRDSPARHIAD